MNNQAQQGFARDVAKLASASVFANALGVAASPVLTRLFAPEAFGLLGLFNAVLGVLAVGATLKYDGSIMIPIADDDARNLLFVCLALSCAWSSLIVLLVTMAGGRFASVVNARELANYLWLMPISVLAAGVFASFNQWFTRTGDYGLLAGVRVVKSVATTGSKVGSGLGGYLGAGFLIGSNVVGAVLGSIALGGQFLRQRRGATMKPPTVARARTLALKYRKFPIYNLPTALLNALSVYMPQVLLAMFFSTTALGFYAIGYATLGMPMDLVGRSIGQVFYQRSVDAKNRGALGELVGKTLLSLVALGVFPMLIVAVAGRELFAFVFGFQWAEAGVYAQILAPWTLMVFVGSPLSGLFNTIEKQEVNLGFNLVLLATRVTSLVIGGLLADPRIALCLFSASGVLAWGWFIHWAFRSSKLRPKPILMQMVRHLGICAPFLVALIGAKLIFWPSVLPVVGASIAAAAGFLVAAIRYDTSFRDASHLVWLKFVGVLK